MVARIPRGRTFSRPDGFPACRLERSGGDEARHVLESMRLVERARAAVLATDEQRHARAAGLVRRRAGGFEELSTQMAPSHLRIDGELYEVTGALPNPRHQRHRQH